MRAQNWMIRIAVVLLCLVCVTTYFVTGLNARYRSNAEGTDDARVAVMAMDATYVLAQELPMEPGGFVEFEVTLTNNADGQICEVAQSFSMTVEELTDNLGLSVEYYLMEDATETKVDEATGVFDAGIEKEVTYKVKVTWDGVPQPASSAFEVDALMLVVRAEQID